MNECDVGQSFYTYIGQRIRERRKLLKMSQSQLADLIGFSCQQIQKYESGVSQASIGRLLQLSRALNVPVAYFYEGAKLDDEIGIAIPDFIVRNDRTRPLRVLLVEDSAADVILFRKALSACPEPLDLHVIPDSEQVMSYLQKHATPSDRGAPDLVMLDISLPKISGLQLLKLIKNNPETVRLPVVILTNSVSSKEMDEAYHGGAAGFIQKRMEMEEYVESIQSAMRYWCRTVALPATSQSLVEAS
jgi:CheY-like chemotaxis protein/DNA-binding XRE family transcriptional regulator